MDKKEKSTTGNAHVEDTCSCAVFAVRALPLDSAGFLRLFYQLKGFDNDLAIFCVGAGDGVLFCLNHR